MKKYGMSKYLILIICSVVLIIFLYAKISTDQYDFEIQVALDYEKSTEQLLNLDISYDQYHDQLANYVSKHYFEYSKNLIIFQDKNTSKIYYIKDLIGLSDEELEGLKQAFRNSSLQYKPVLDNVIVFSDTYEHDILDSKWIYSKKTYSGYKPTSDVNYKRFVYSKYVFVKEEEDWKLSAVLTADVVDDGLNKEGFERQEGIIFEELLKEGDQYVNFIHEVELR